RPGRIVLGPVRVRLMGGQRNDVPALHRPVAIVGFDPAFPPKARDDQVRGRAFWTLNKVAGSAWIEAGISHEQATQQGVARVLPAGRARHDHLGLAAETLATTDDGCHGGCSASLERSMASV